jgi:hypothetical protein
MKDSCEDIEILIYENFTLLGILLMSTSVVDGGVSEANPVLTHVELGVIGTCHNSIDLYFCLEIFRTIKIIFELYFRTSTSFHVLEAYLMHFTYRC